jgi:hypothetical protein
MITRGLRSDRLTLPVPIRRLRALPPARRSLLFIACFLAATLGSPVPARADGQLWVLASMSKSFAESWRVNVEVAPRWERDASDYSRTVMRAQVGKFLRKTLVVGGGYEFQNPASFYVRREHRIWQQVAVQQQAGGWLLSHRARLEERWLRNIDPLVVRARYQFRAGRPLGSSGDWTWFVIDELLVTVRGDDLVYPQGLDRHRLGAGIGRALSPHLTVETGYTWQAINRPGRIPVQNDHLFLVNLLARY